MLDAVPETTAVGEAGTGEEAIAQAKSLTPDVILMDIQMSDMNGIEATRRNLNDRLQVADRAQVIVKAR